MPNGSYVLVVDDDADARRLISDVVKMLDLPTREAADGQEALDIVAQEQPALIVLDVMMPGMDGFATVTQLQGNRATRNIPIILLTAMTGNEEKLEKLPGVRGVLYKARFSPMDLSKLIEKLLF